MRAPPDDIGDKLMPQQPIGRLVTKGDVASLEYDPLDAPEFIPGEYGGGEFSWEPLTPEGGLLDDDEDYEEMALPVPVDRLDYILAAGYMDAREGENYRTYLDDEIVEVDGRRWQNVVLRGTADGVMAGQLRLMTGVMHRRPWEVGFDEPEKPAVAGALKEAAAPVELPTADDQELEKELVEREQPPKEGDSSE